ncbi:MAG: tail fiber domain-containing protein [Saprospiraceae bacterium]|nr:tail fiber domain-containing protein [Saprospiraceae bacterium]
MGRESGRSNGGGYQNTIIGSASAYANTSGSNNLIMGAYSGNTNSTGEMNVILGAYSGRINTTGSYNIMIGPQNYTGASNTGSSNIFIGSDAGISNTTAGGNLFMGTETGKTNSTGFNNLFIGHSAGKFNTTANNNTYIGILSGGSNTTGTKNVCLGYFSGTTITTGSENTVLGYNADLASNNQNNSMAIGNTAVSQGSNKVKVGNSNVTEIGGQVAWSTLSDKRFKSNIKNDVPGLEFIKKLKPVTYYVNTRMITENLIRNMHDSIKEIYRKTDFSESSNIKRTGFLAQDVEVTCQEIGYDFDGVNIPKDKENLYSLSYSQFVVPLVKAVQEQELKIEELNIELGQQKQINAEKDRLLSELLKRIEIIELKLK